MKFSAERIVGGTGAQKEEAEMYLREVFEHQDRDKLSGIEVEKSQEVLEDISLANEVTSAVLTEYGIQKEDIGADKIHVIRKEEWPERLSRSGAFFSFTKQGIAVRDGEPQVGLVHDLIHEIFHFKSYLAGQVTLHGKLDNYRVGVTVNSRDGEREMFEGLNEAITEELTYQATQNPMFQRVLDAELQRIDRDIKHHSDAIAEDGSPLFTDQTYYVEVGEKNEDGSFPIHTKSFAYPKEREALKLLAKKLYEHNKDSFQDVDAVFGLFVKSAFSGDLLKIGRLIEDSFGVGTLRKIAEHNSENEFLKLISSL